MDKYIDVLKSCKLFYVATVDRDKPQVRPFSSITEFEGHPYICTNNQKAVFLQFLHNPRIAICALHPDGSWYRISAAVSWDQRDEARSAMLSDPTGPSHVYHVGDGIFEVFRLDQLSGKKYHFCGTQQICEDL